MSLTLEGPVIVPVADPDDGERTANALLPFLAPAATVVVLNVIEKGGGAVDKAPLAQRKEYAQDVFERTQEPLEAAGVTVETEIRYGTDIVETIFDGALERDADTVAFVPRKGNRFVELLTGTIARRLIREAKIPVVALPQGQAQA